MTIQEILGAFLSVQGQHEAAARAFESTTRAEWESLVTEAIRTAPESERTNVAWKLKLELDKPENGGPGAAADFLIRKEIKPTAALLAAMGKPANPAYWYRAYRIDPEGAVYVNMASDYPDTLLRRLVATFVVREVSGEK